MTKDYREYESAGEEMGGLPLFWAAGGLTQVKLVSFMFLEFSIFMHPQKRKS